MTGSAAPGWLDWARYYAGRFDAATGPLREGIELTARSGRRQQFAMAVLGHAAVELWLGQLATAEASAQQALSVSLAIGDATWTSAALAILAEIGRVRRQAEGHCRPACRANRPGQRGPNGHWSPLMSHCG